MAIRGGQNHSSTVLMLSGFSPVPVSTNQGPASTSEVVQAVMQKSSAFLCIDSLSGSLKGSGNRSLQGHAQKGAGNCSFPSPQSLQ